MPRVVFSKAMWVGRARALVLALMTMVAVLVASLLVLAVATRSAEAAFPGGNGVIAFYSDRDREPGDIFTMSPTGDVSDRLTTFATGGSINPAVSPDGSRIAFSRDGEIWVMKASGMNSNGTGATQITDTSTAKTKPTWSPDGTRIAYVASSFDVDGETDLEIWAINADGSGRTQLTDNTVPIDDQPAWSPDGSTIAFVSARTGDANRNIYLMDADPTTDDATATDLTQNSATPLYGGNDDQPSWSPNGTHIAYSNDGDGDADIYKMDTDPGTKDWANLTDLTNPQQGEVDPGDAEPAWSPDGNSIAYVSEPTTPDSSTERNIYVMNANVAGRGAPLNSEIAHDISPDWQPLLVDPATCDVSDPTDPNGDNTLTGDPAEDEVICGLGGNDTMTGQDGDILVGGDGNDTLMVPSGRATLDGGPGKDTASFAGSARRISASLISGFAQRLGTNPLEGVALVAVENLTGSGLDDMLRGSNAANRLVGGDGADELYGLGANDRLDSRDGVRRNDTVDGGKGTDDMCTTDRTEKLITRCE